MSSLPLSPFLFPSSPVAVPHNFQMPTKLALCGKFLRQPHAVPGSLFCVCVCLCVCAMCCICYGAAFVSLSCGMPRPHPRHGPTCSTAAKPISIFIFVSARASMCRNFLLNLGLCNFYMPMPCPHFRLRTSLPLPQAAAAAATESMPATVQNPQLQLACFL